MLGVIDTLEQHINMENQDANIHVGPNEATCVLPTTNTPAEAVARRRKRTHEATSSAVVQSITPGDTGNAPTRSKKRAKRSPSPITEANPANALAAVQVARALNMGSTTIRIIISSREYLREEERSEEETDDNLQAIDQQESTLDDDDDDDDDDDQCGGGEKGTTPCLPASNRRSTHTSFDERFEALMEFKDEFGHCNVTKTKSGNHQALGNWCGNLKVSYQQIKKGDTPRIKLTGDRIRQLEVVGFKWSLLPPRRSFEDYFEELVKFKQKFGHCNAPRTKSSEYYSLGKWCSNLKVSYKQIQKGKKPNNKLTDDGIRRLKDVGFNLTRSIFDEHFEELAKFKHKFGHCDVSSTKSGGYHSLGNWCAELRGSYKQIQTGAPPRMKLALENIQRLEEVGFKWQWDNLIKISKK